MCPNAAGGTNIFAGSPGGGIFLSTNNGTRWTTVNTGLTNKMVISLLASPNGTAGTNIFAGTGWGVSLSTNNGVSWKSVLETSGGYSLASSGINIFVGTWYDGISLSTNNGTSWTQVNSGLPKSAVVSLTAIGTKIFAGTYDDGVYLFN